MLAKFRHAALLAALMVLTATAAQAQPSGCCSGCGYCPVPCCTKKCGDGAACKKDKKCDCTNGGDCCCEKKCECDKGKKSCPTQGACGTFVITNERKVEIVELTKKCDCTKGGECCCGKNCECGKSKSCGKEKGRGCCANIGKLTVIAVMPALPVLGGCPAAGLLPPPPVMPVPPQMAYGCPMAGFSSPVPPCPPVAPPEVLRKETAGDCCAALLGAVGELCCTLKPLSMPALCVSAAQLLTTEGTFAPCSPCPAMATCPQGNPPMPTATLLPPPVPEAHGYYGSGSTLASGCVPCCPVSAVTLAPAAVKMSITANADGDCLQWNVGDGGCVSCKKMTVKLGDEAVKLSRLGDQVRVRGDELSGRADRVGTDRKDRLVLEGNAALHYHKDGQRASVSAERIEINLATGAVTIKPLEPSSCTPASYRTTR